MTHSNMKGNINPKNPDSQTIYNTSKQKFFKQIFYNFITSGFTDEIKPKTYFRLVFLNLTLFTAIIIDSYLLIHSIFNNSNFILLICIQLVVFIFALVILRVLKKIELVTYPLVIFAMISLLVNVPTGGIGKTGLYWLPIFPLISFFLLGRRSGALLTITMICIAWILVYFGNTGYIEKTYNYTELSQSLVALGAISIMVYIFETLRQSHLSKLVKKETELQLYESAINNANDQVVITDSDGIVKYANPIMEKLTGYSSNEALGKKAGALWGGYMPKEYYENMWYKIKIEKKPFIGRIKNKNKSGDFYYVDIHISPITDKNQEVQFFVSIERDASFQYQIEKSQRQLDAFFELSPEIMVIANTDGYFKKVNQAFPDILGYTEKELLETPFIKLVHPDDTKSTIREVERLGEGAKTIHFTNRYRKKSGEYLWLQWNASPDGTNLYASARDVSKEKEIDQMKTEFISLASHQLKTPASGVKAFLSMLLEGDAGKLSNRQKEFVSTAFIGNEQEIKIVDDLLNVARIESGRLVIEKKLIDLSEVITEMITQFRGALKMKNQKLEFKKENGDYHLFADKDKLWMALGNFIDNASKYTPEKGRVTVVITSINNTIEIIIKDTGVGISKENQKKLFKKFSRIDNPLSAKAGGTGLGLYLSQQIIDLHSGKINVKSTLGKGTEFIIQLPKDNKS